MAHRRQHHVCCLSVLTCDFKRIGEVEDPKQHVIFTDTLAIPAVAADDRGWSRCSDALRFDLRGWCPLCLRGCYRDHWLSHEFAVRDNHLDFVAMMSKK